MEAAGECRNQWCVSHDGAPSAGSNSARAERNVLGSRTREAEDYRRIFDRRSNDSAEPIYDWHDRLGHRATGRGVARIYETTPEAERFQLGASADDLLFSSEQHAAAARR